MNKNTKSKVVHFRLSKDEYDMLVAISNEFGDNFSKILRTALRLYYHMRFENRV